MQFHINKLITGSFILAVALLGLIGFVTDRSTTRLIQTAEQVNHTHEVLEMLEAVLSDVADVETGQRGYVISGNDKFLIPYRAALTDIQAHTNRLHELVADNPGQRAKVAQLDPLITTKLTGVQETIRVRTVEGFAAAQVRVAGGNGQPVMDEIRQRVAEMRATELELLKQRDERARGSARNAFTFAWIGSGVSMLLLVFSFSLLRREIAERQRAEAVVKNLNQNLLAHSAKLEAANQELEAFSYSVSHDLRAPLRHISGFVGLLQKEGGLPGAKPDRYLKMIADSARQMGSLIDDLLEFSRMGRAEMSITRVNLQQLAADVRDELAAANAGRAIIWRLGNLPEVHCDPAMLRLVFVNLLANAVKFTGHRPQAEITVDCRTGEAEHILFVRDNGVGFDMKHVDKLFGVFQRLHHADEFEGTGIGLASVRRIIHRHGGRTWAEAAPDQGATFYFSLPKDHPATTLVSI